MAARLLRGRILVASVTMVVALASGLATFGQREPAKGSARQKQAREAEPVVVGEEACNKCHQAPSTAPRAKGRRIEYVCRFVESKVFDDRDKHKNAVKVLADARGKRMGQLLGIDDVTKAAACLSCHGIAPKEDVENVSYDPVEDGVTCIACHGGDNRWIGEHQNPVTRWINLSREDKERDWGMVDLWNPVRRAEKCTSCHVGNAAEGKVVTHTMYAAGHPPLPGFEVATFSDAEPRHWQYLKEKPAEVQKRLSYDRAELEQAKIVAVSGLVPLREALKLFAAQARGDGLVRNPDQHWPDFARFDCYACHHDLQAPGYLAWRQVRGFADAPGRPPAPSWPAVLVELGVQAAGADQAKDRLDRFRSLQQSYRSALGEQPYGATDRTITAAEALAAWADEVLGDLNKTTVDTAKAKEMLGWIIARATDASPARTLDYDSARQLYWAFQTVYSELGAPDPAVVRALGRIEKQLIPTAAEPNNPLASRTALPSAGVQEAIEKTLPIRLEAVEVYQPERFQGSFALLAKNPLQVQGRNRPLDAEQLRKGFAALAKELVDRPEKSSE